LKIHPTTAARSERHADLPRVLRRIVGLVRFSRRAVDATAASVFLIEDDGRSLCGVVSDWDWTRTSFSSKLADWPSVASAMDDGEIKSISVNEAHDSERGWFEPRGIALTLCVPLRMDDVRYGVLFFDFTDPPIESRATRALLADVARRCTRALARDASAPHAGASPSVH
jgi:hypothetical protein